MQFYYFLKPPLVFPRHPLGGFYSAEDADSLPTPSSTAKREGAFCVWTKKELKELLKNEGELELFCRVFSVKEEGNVDPR